MSFEEIESLVVRKLPLPEYVQPLDRATYISLRGLYRQFERKELSHEAARTEKQQIKLEHEMMSDSGRWQYLGRTLSSYYDNRTLENADMMFNAICALGYGGELPQKTPRPA